MSSPAGRRDIETPQDVEHLVRAFYSKAMTDPMIGYLFVDVARLDLEAHVPVIASFWETILLGTGDYRGGAFAPHASLHRKSALRAGHFERWLWLWRGTVDELFAGERAELAKSHANRVGRAFYQRIESLDAAAAARDGAPASVLPLTQHGPRAAEG